MARVHRIAAGAFSVLLFATSPGNAEDSVGALAAEVDGRAAQVEGRVRDWRRDIHQHPELSNREHRTAALVADHLEALGLEVRRGIAHTGVVGVLRGGLPGSTVALRADMDALPVTEEVDLPFASTARSTYLGQDVGVMHACGHDVHTAVLMGVAEVLSGVREQLPGTVVFVFQPAEERPPPGERGGAELMLEEGVFDDPTPDVIFGLHVVSQHEVGELAFVSGGAMSSSDVLNIRIIGRQTHAAYPWKGVDSIAVASRIVLALQALPARRVDARIPSIISIGSIHGGVRHNIIPEEVSLLGTIRSLDEDQRQALHEQIRSTAMGIARSAGAEAEVDIKLGYPITHNDPALTARMLPTLERVAGKERVVRALPRTGAEDFAFYQQRVPGLYIWLGGRPVTVAATDAAPNHSPRFFVDEGALPLGVRALSGLAVDFLTSQGAE